MTGVPALETARLILRPFTLADAPEVQRLAGDPAVADTTLNIPHPYPDGAAEEWISTHQRQFEQGTGVIFAVTLRETGALVGATSLLGISRQHQNAEMGYWIGKPYWNQGYATEAARALIVYAFDELGLHKVYAHYLVRNPASGRVMQKAGMAYEGTLRQHVQKSGVFEDLKMYGLCQKV